MVRYISASQLWNLGVSSEFSAKHVGSSVSAGIGKLDVPVHGSGWAK